MLFRGDNDFAANFMGNPVFLAETDHRGAALDAKPRFQRSGLIVQASVYDAAVVPRLMRSDLIFLIKNENPKARVPPGQFQSDRKANDSGADDGNVAVLIHCWDNSPGLRSTHSEPCLSACLEIVFQTFAPIGKYIQLRRLESAIFQH